MIKNVRFVWKWFKKKEKDLDCYVNLFIESKLTFILSVNCEHAFCLTCIREWRTAAQIAHSHEEINEGLVQKAFF